MTIIDGDQSKRLLVPRWRTFNETLLSHELGNSLRSNKTFESLSRSPEATRAFDNWNRSPNISTAAELVETGVVLGIEQIALDAAKFLSSEHCLTTPLIKSQSKRLVSRIVEKSVSPNSKLIEIRADEFFSDRELIAKNSLNPFPWIDLALKQTLSGALGKALRSMNVAIKLAPQNRHVLRTAARLLVHLGDPEKAHQLILESGVVSRDPWLMAAEISIAQLADKKPKFVKTGLHLIDAQQFPNFQTTELASAIASLEIGENRKKMKRLFNHSLLSPTGNALAQAAWAGPVAGVQFLPENYQFGREFEAPARIKYYDGDFENALLDCQQWIKIEGFSSRPLEFAAATASIVGKYQETLDYVSKGLSRSPYSAELSLTRAFALANLGRLNEASICLDAIERNLQDKFLVSFSKANRGLIAFREFKITAAKESYGSAISGFRSIGDFVNEANALAYFAFESIKINDKQAREVLRRAVDATIKSKRAVVARHILKKIFKSSEVRNWITTEQLKQISSGAKLEVNDAND